jgi:putative acyl-CoA dehydrogenase
MEVLGGNGYVEEGPIARRFRELPLNSIWEGSGNIMCIDVLRAISREDGVRDALASLLQESIGCDSRYDQHVEQLFGQLNDVTNAETHARCIVENIALATQAAVLLKHGPSFVAEAFLASRISRGAPAAFGTLPAGLAFNSLIERALSG